MRGCVEILVTLLEWPRKEPISRVAEGAWEPGRLSQGCCALAAQVTNRL